MRNDLLLFLMFFVIGWFGGHAYTIVKIDFNCYADGETIVRGNKLFCTKGIDHDIFTGVQ